jgi:stage V sporulation protein D (sporulation-specific penicillin-binding protein)
MADILPYLGVAQNFENDDSAGKSVIMEDLSGLTDKESANILKGQGLTALKQGTGEHVTGQIPAAGQSVPAGSQVILYFGDPVPEETVTVPDFAGMNRQQAADAAGKLGLYILPAGNLSVSPQVTVTIQEIPPGTKVQIGTTIKLTFTDTHAAD